MSVRAKHTAGDTHWYAFDEKRKKPIAYSTNADTLIIDVFVSETPLMSIADFKEYLLKNTLVRGKPIEILQAYIDKKEGWHCCGGLFHSDLITQVNGETIWEKMTEAEKERGHK